MTIEEREDSYRKLATENRIQCERLRMIIDQLESGEKGLFIILDEILKGTNSKDKQHGALSLMRRHIGLGGIGIIATHDLALGNLVNEFPQEIESWHFDALISDDTLTFSYKIQEGIAQNMNASFLMKKMGITDEFVHPKNNQKLQKESDT